jgi:hypothetical protein
MTWKIFSNKPWNIFSRHLRGLFWDQQWYTDYKHGFGQKSCQK